MFSVEPSKNHLVQSDNKNIQTARNKIIIIVIVFFNIFFYLFEIKKITGPYRETRRTRVEAQGYLSIQYS